MLREGLLALAFAWTVALPVFGSASEVSANTSAIARDASTLPDLLRQEHPSPFWRNGPALFEAAEANLRGLVAGGADDEAIATAMMVLIAAIGEGHTTFADRYETFGIAPFFAEIHEDGVFLVRVPSSKGDALGAEILGVGSADIDEVLDRLRAVVPHSNESRFRRWGRSYLHLPGLLHALGLTPSRDQVVLSLRLENGRVTQETFGRASLDDYDELDMIDLEPPFTLRTSREMPYWFAPLKTPTGDVVYAKFDRCTTSDEESVWDLGRRLATYIRERESERLILDLRDNGGGGYQYVAHLRPLLADLPSIDRPGGFVVLTGKKTFSAACDLLSQFNRFTHAVTIGQTPGGSVGEPGDDDDFQLPESGLTIRISQVAGRDRNVIDTRRTFTPDVHVEERFADLMAGRDPVLEAALAYESPVIEPPSPDSWRESPGPDDTKSLWTGRYRLEPGIDLVIALDQGQWRATALPILDTPIYSHSRTQFWTAVPGLLLSVDEDTRTVRLHRADGTTILCPPKGEDTPSPWELVFDGKIAEARPGLEAALREAPDHPSLSDGAFTSEAIHLVFSQEEKLGREAARLAARELLLTGIALHPEGAPQCEFSLRFYPAPEE